MIKRLIVTVSFVVVFLSGCGGGGGGSATSTSPPAPPSFTENVVCPTGETKSATAPTRQEAYDNASGQCSKITGSISAANGVSPDALLADGFIFTATGTMQVPEVIKVIIQLGDSNGTLVPIVLSDITPKSFKVKIPVKQNYSQTLYFKASLSDSLGRQFMVIANFTTGICPSNSTVSISGDACIYQKGVILSMPDNLPATMSITTDAAFRAATVSGQAYLVETDIMASNSAFVVDQVRPIVMAVYRLNNKTITKPLFRDTLTDVQSHNNVLTLGMTNSVFDKFMGAPNGLIMRGQPGNKCWIAAWYGNTPGYTPGFYFDDYSACPDWTKSAVQSLVEKVTMEAYITYIPFNGYRAPTNQE